MTTEFNRESAKDVWDEAEPLLREHYKEIAHFKDIPLMPDKDRYLMIEGAGALVLFTCREQGVLIGYNMFFLSGNMHYSDSLQAVQDILYIHPLWRGKMIGVRFIKWCDQQLSELGAEVVYQHLKARAGLNYGPMLERIGYELMDLVYVKRLRERGGV